MICFNISLYIVFIIYNSILRMYLSYEYVNDTGLKFWCCQTNTEQNFSFVKSPTRQILK